MCRSLSLAPSVAALLVTLGCASTLPPPESGQAEPISPLVIRGAPAIPEDLSLEMAHYLDARPISLQAISDDGQNLLMTSRFEETSQLFYLAAGQDEPKQLTF